MCCNDRGETASVGCADFKKYQLGEPARRRLGINALVVELHSQALNYNMYRYCN
jgi:hypothetical protein